MKRPPSLNRPLNILTHPRQTIKKIISYNPNYFLLILSFIYGFPWILNLAQTATLGRMYPQIQIVIAALLLAIPIGYIAFSFFSLLYLWIGKLIQGKGSFLTIRSAVAWSNVPNAISILIWIVFMVLFRDSLFNDGIANVRGFSNYAMIAFIIQVICSIWAFWILLSTLSQVQKFSLWKALLNIVLVFLVCFILTFGLSFIYLFIRNH